MQTIKIHGIKDSCSIAFKGGNVFNQILDKFYFHNNSEVIKMAWNEESEDKSDFEDDADSDWDDTEKDEDSKEEVDSDSDGDTDW